MTISPAAFCPESTTTDMVSLLEADALVRWHTPIADVAEAMSYFYEHFLKKSAQVIRGNALDRKAEACISMLVNAHNDWEKAATSFDMAQCSISSQLVWGASDVAAWMEAPKVFTKMLQEFSISANADAMVSSADIVQKLCPQYLHWLSDALQQADGEAGDAQGVHKGGVEQ